MGSINDLSLYMIQLFKLMLPKSNVLLTMSMLSLSGEVLMLLCVFHLLL